MNEIRFLEKFPLGRPFQEHKNEPIQWSCPLCGSGYQSRPNDDVGICCIDAKDNTRKIWVVSKKLAEKLQQLHPEGDSLPKGFIKIGYEKIPLRRDFFICIYDLTNIKEYFKITF